MRVIAAVFGFVAGASVGSFLELAAWRLPRGEPIVRGRSRCPSCGTTLAWYDNVPVVSWLVLRGRCRRCGWPIPVRHVLVEVGAGIVAAAAAWLLV